MSNYSSMQYVNPNDLSSAIFDMYDLKRTIKFLGLNDEPKDNEGTEITVGDCISDVLLFLEELDANSRSYGSSTHQEEAAL